jgi:hypothetical protein
MHGETHDDAAAPAPFTTTMEKTMKTRTKIVTAMIALTLAGAAVPAKATEDNLAGFAKLAWAEKLRIVTLAGGQTRVDCTGAHGAGGGPCLEIVEWFHPSNGNFIELRSAASHGLYQWCRGSTTAGRMDCYSQVTGAATAFILFGNEWHSVN